MHQISRRPSLAGPHRAPLAAACAMLLLAAAPAPAVIVEIEYIARNGAGGFPDFGGPHWKGKVDTVANYLKIEEWTDLPGTPLFWTPVTSSLPLIWPAVKSVGGVVTPYDVPDDFDGHIDLTFAFVSETSAMNMDWNEGNWADNGVISFPAADFFPGWGGVRRPPPGGGPLVLDTSFDETTMPLLPSGVFDAALWTGAEVIITLPASIGVVPEASALLFGVVVAATTAAWTAFRRLSHENVR